jgi:hypothetical protein
MQDTGVLEIRSRTPLLLRRIERKPCTQSLRRGINRRFGRVLASHMTVVTTSGMRPEMHDQEEDSSRDD